MAGKFSLKDNQGASSILVIVMMVVLLVFGLAVLTTSLSNVRLGNRKKAWLADYYTLEGEAMAAIADYDHILAKAMERAPEHALSDDFLSRYGLQATASDEVRSSYEVAAYMDLAIEGLTQAIAGNQSAALYHGDMDIDAFISGTAAAPIELRFAVTLPDSDHNKSIQVTMAIPGANGNRYSLQRFVQSQDAFDYDDGLNFDDPFGENDPFEDVFDQ